VKRKSLCVLSLNLVTKQQQQQQQQQQQCKIGFFFKRNEKLT
jgi:hypothetical protein